ncbi:hypothetical protein QW060_05795 [Myroides ceti]|uniref:Uncharacterized protein n=1 Tax=Paenimyroides ceti TaxID=395087 RepID=A0ABT8CTW2_9FLAO|nr:hypothetical protein [Paenimyroides ceti]MDN3706642.1 hypothetical protein [Paenimyroides ceti]
MKKYFFISTLLLTGLLSYAQNKHIIEADNLSESQLTTIDKMASKDGWVLIKYKGENYIRNFSNSDYILSLSVHCSDTSKKPGYLIEYSDRYGDGEMGGLDFSSATSQYHAKVVFYLDGKSYENPFASGKNKNMKPFFENLKKAKKLRIDFFDAEFNPETAKEELKINRSIEFKTANAELLDQAVNCS